MGIVRGSQPIIEGVEEAVAFRTYFHYLKSICGLIGNRRDSPALIVEKLRGDSHFLRIQQKPLADLDRVERRFRIAWGTEVTLAAAEAMEPEQVMYANLWAPIQAYYASYLALQALIAASTKPPAQAHADALAVVGEDLRSGHLVAPAPWCVVCTSAFDPLRVSLPRVPDSAAIMDINPQATPTSNLHWSFYAKALRTTRGRDLDDLAVAWRKGKKTKGGKPRQNTPSLERARIEAGMPPTSLFSFLYRLRIRSNYRDADMLLDGPSNDSEGVEFNECFRYLVDRTLLVLEINASAHIGSRALCSMAERFIGSKDGPRARSPLSRRIEAIRR